MRLSDNFFKKYFRMDRPSFNALLENIKPHFSYQRSSGFLIHPAIRLAITLRFLAGGSYLDLAFAFEVPHNTIMKYIWEVCEAIDASLNNINFPLGDEQGLRDLEQGFMRISGGVFQGTVAAGDGVVFRMQRPHREAVDGDVASFFTRKGYYAYGMQGFVDSSCKFLSISMKLCSSAHRGTHSTLHSGVVRRGADDGNTEKPYVTSAEEQGILAQGLLQDWTVLHQL